MNTLRHRGRRIPGLSAPVVTLLSAVAASFRGLIPGVVVLSCLVGLIAPANAAAPVVPLVTAHHHWDHHWDHHWFVWLPRHPVYESVEIMSIDSARNFYRAVWLFFTERHGGKHQVHYFDDRQIVGHFPGSHYGPIDYERSGARGKGRSVRVALTGLDDVPVEIVVDLADRPLTRTGAGLTNQSGHSAGTLFLLFHRDRVALARTNEVRIGANDYSFRAGDDPAARHRFMAAYSTGIQIAVIPFGQWSFSRHEERLSANASGLSFAVTEPDGGVRLTASQPGHRNRIAVDLSTDGALTGYRHDAAAHRLALSFDAAVPLAVDSPRSVNQFAVYMNPDEPVARGEVVSEPMDGRRRLTWRFHSPQWAAQYPFESIIKLNGGGYTLVIQSLSR